MAKGVIYDAYEVALLWQSWANRRRNDYSPDTLRRPGTRDSADPRLRAWLWVESFFTTHFEFAYDRPFWLLGVPSDALLAAFGAWYEKHPLRRQLSADDVQSVARDFEPITIAEACIELKCSRNALQKAAKHGALHAWKPKGMVWHTNRYQLAKWKAENPQGGVRAGAGRRKAA